MTPEERAHRAVWVGIDPSSSNVNVLWLHARIEACAKEIREAVAEEREACAQIAQEREDDGHSCGDYGGCCVAGVADKIRARG